MDGTYWLVPSVYPTICVIAAAAAAAAAAIVQALIKMGMGRRSLLASLAADGKPPAPAGE
jgi:high-affinity Fe2+/Pb2+ permease